MRAAAHVWLLWTFWGLGVDWSASYGLNDSSLPGETFGETERTNSSTPVNLSSSLYILGFDEGSLADWYSLAGRRRNGGDSHTGTIKALLVAAYCLIIVISLFGNSLVCHVVVKNKRMQSATSLFIVNLAVADILITILNTPFTLVRFVSSTWVFGRGMCHISRFVQYCSLHVSTLTLTAIALDRRQVILHPMRPRMSRAQGGVWVAAIWTMASCFSLPHAIYQKLLTFAYREKERSLCVPDFPEPSDLHWQYIDLLTFILLYALPLLIITAAYTTVARQLWRRNTIGDTTTAQHATQRRKRRRTLAMLLLVVGVFAICWLPLNCYVVLLSSQAIHSSNALYFCFHWLAMSSTCYNPFIYCCLNPAFRQELRVLLSICKRRRQVRVGEVQDNHAAAALLAPRHRTAWPDNRESSRPSHASSQPSHASPQQSHQSSAKTDKLEDTHVLLGARQVLSGRKDILSVQPIEAVI